jgi:predicted transcriptional regulator
MTIYNYTIPNTILRSEMNSASKLVFCVLLHYSIDNKVQMSMDKIAKEISLNILTVRKALEELEGFGLISKVLDRTSTRKRYIYEIKGYGV